MSDSAAFDEIYRRGRWTHGGTATPSGPGSSVDNSRPVLEMLERIKFETLCDIGCGDLNFMSDFLARQELDHGWISYTGIDISPEALKIARAANPYRGVFVQADITAPHFEVHADVVVCKDMLFHLENQQIVAALQALERSTWEYLITNTDRGAPHNRSLDQYHWAPADLEGPLLGPHLRRLGKVVARETRPAHGEYLLIQRNV